MKKLMKKSLVLLIVVMTMILTAFCISAQANGNTNYCSVCKTYVPVIEGKTVGATCEQYGYAEMICKPCYDDADKDGVSLYTVLFREKTAEASGHMLVDNYVLADDGLSYKKVTTCGRIANGTPCKYNITATYEDKTVIKFYNVTYVNSFVTTKTDENFAYTTLATAYKEEVLHTEYVQEGTKASYNANPYRMADKNYGEYVFVGWAQEAQPADSDNSKLPTYFNGFDIPLEGVKTPNYKFYAIFKGLEVSHSITFYSERGDKLKTLEDKIPHGAIISEFAPDSRIPTAPIKGDNAEFKYTFRYWSLFNRDAEFDFSKEPIYDDIKVKASYTPTLKRYLLKYVNKDGDTVGEEFVTATILGDDLLELPHKGLDIKSNPDINGVTSSYFDASYDYDFTGNWLIEGRNNHVIDIKNIRFPEGTLDYEQTKSYITVVPEYRKIARVYDLVVFVTYDDDGNYHPTDVSLQITDANGSPIGVAKLTEKDIIDPNARVETYKKVFKVHYSPSYRVVATAKNYKGEVNPTFNYGGDVYNNYRPGGANVLLEREKDGPCGCICHTIFKPVWVGVLNLLHSLFKAEYICCDDMFANIGDNLSYGPGKN